MPELKEPIPYLIRQETETIKDPEIRMFAKVILTCGGRTVEFAGKNCHNEKAYGTIGAGHAWIENYQPKTTTMEELTNRLTELSNKTNANIAELLGSLLWFIA